METQSQRVKHIFLKTALLITTTFFFGTFSFATSPAPYVAADHYQVSAGGAHSCAIDDNGVHCWGSKNGGNWAGQTDVPNLTNPVAVSAGQTHTCAIDASGVHCWGGNWAGQTDVPSLTNPVAVSADYGNTCAIDDNGVHCWGWSYYGESEVPSLIHPVAVSAGSTHTCAIDDNGVHCWGNNAYGQTDVPSLTNPTAVSAGVWHTCALDDNGVHCWGDNFDGQTDVPDLTHPVAVSTGDHHTCALDDNGVHCWGSNFFGQIDVPSLTNPVAVSAGVWHTCALDDNGVHCWGYNQQGQCEYPCLTFNGVACSLVSISAKASSGGGITPSGKISVVKGNDASFEIIPNLPAKYEISDVKVDGVSQGAISSYTFSNVEAKHKILASFKVRSYNITVTNEQPALGKLNFTGVKTLSYGKFLTIKATPLNNNKTLKAEISVDGNVVRTALLDKAATYQLLVDGEHAISVRFF